VPAQAASTLNTATSDAEPNGHRKAYYARLFRRFILLTILCSLVPLLAVGWGINLHYTRFAKERMVNSFRTQVDYHRKIIEMFLEEHRSKLHLIAHSHSREDLTDMTKLNEVFELINHDHWSITDLGVIGENGDHLAYIGPFDLMEKNYRQAFWFREAMQKGFYISDMFMGFRKEPHFVIAVLRNEADHRWILRATIDTEVFRSLVENVKIGQTGEVYLLNEVGVFQTSPRFTAKIMDKADYPMPPRHEGIRIHTFGSRKSNNGHKIPAQIAGQTWLQNPRWLLVVKQDYAEAFDAVNHANYSTLIFLHLSALTILIVAVLTTRHMIGVIKNRDNEADHLNRQLMQAGKLASIGELSAGVAHEINNPLAIILTERQILLDATSRSTLFDEAFKVQLFESLTQIDVQVQRCKRITQNLLRFARRTQSMIETVDINAFIEEVVELMEREARASGIKFFTDLQPELPPLLSDPSQLQQVFLNLITNSIDAHDGRPYGKIEITTRDKEQAQGIRIIFADTGSGIAAEHLEKIFDPFFTTKAVGKGTGLGLSICYSIIKHLGGQIAVHSEVNRGTRFTIDLPYTPPPALLESMPAGDRASTEWTERRPANETANTAG
jgi:two-component system NtrC family sensor kinase